MNERFNKKKVIIFVRFYGSDPKETFSADTVVLNILRSEIDYYF